MCDEKYEYEGESPDDRWAFSILENVNYENNNENDNNNNNDSNQNNSNNDKNKNNDSNKISKITFHELTIENMIRALSLKRMTKTSLVEIAYYSILRAVKEGYLLEVNYMDICMCIYVYICGYTENIICIYIRMCFY